MKYIVIRGYLDEMPIMFHRSISHADMAASVSAMGRPVSAGFIDIVDGIVSPHGKSDSLSLASRPEDGMMLEDLLEYS